MVHKPYGKFEGEKPDFIIRYEWILKAKETSTNIYQGIRSDFLYEDDDPSVDGVHMIWPEFLDGEGSVIAETDKMISVSGCANMWIVMEERRLYHSQRIQVGTKGYLVAGSTKLASVVVVTNNLPEKLAHLTS